MKTPKTTNAPKKSANPKTNAATAESIAARLAKRKLNTNVALEEVDMPQRSHKSKYPFAELKAAFLSGKSKTSILIEDCTAGNQAAIKATAKDKFGMKLTSFPEGTGYRFWVAAIFDPKPATGNVTGDDPATTETETKAA